MTDGARADASRAEVAHHEAAPTEAAHDGVEQVARSMDARAVIPAPIASDPSAADAAQAQPPVRALRPTLLPMVELPPAFAPTYREIAAATDISAPTVLPPQAPAGLWSKVLWATLALTASAAIAAIAFLLFASAGSAVQPMPPTPILPVVEVQPVAAPVVEAPAPAADQTQDLLAPLVEEEAFEPHVDPDWVATAEAQEQPVSDAAALMPLTVPQAKPAVKPAPRKARKAQQVVAPPVVEEEPQAEVKPRTEPELGDFDFLSTDAPAPTGELKRPEL